MVQGVATKKLVCNGVEGAGPCLAEADMCSPAELLRRHGAGIRRIALRVSRSEAAAQDITQEVLVRVMRCGGFDSSRGSLERWLQIVTKRTAIDWVRRESSHQARVIRVGAVYSASAVVVEEAVEARVRAANVRAAVAQLPDCERELVSLAYFDGLTYRQISDRLGLAEGTVKSRIRRALTRLAHVIQRDFEEW